MDIFSIPEFVSKEDEFAHHACGVLLLLQFAIAKPGVKVTLTFVPEQGAPGVVFPLHPVMVTIWDSSRPLRCAPPLLPSSDTGPVVPQGALFPFEPQVGDPAVMVLVDCEMSAVPVSVVSSS